MNKSLLRPVMHELNSLRGLACLAVLFFHGLWWYIPQKASGFAGFLRDLTRGGYRGVDLFFVLSGLLITNILLESREAPDYFSRFYKRRALRILPAYYAILILLALYGMPEGFLGISLLHAANMAPLAGIGMGYGPLWSLGVEEQFYLVWPLIIRKFSVRLICVLALGISATSNLLSLQLQTSSPQATFPIWHQAHSLALGALLAVFLRSRFGSRTGALIVASGFALSGATFLVAGSLHWERPQLPGLFQGLAWDFLFAALLTFALLLGSSRFEAWMRPKMLLFFGDISYGLYLIHTLVFMVYRRIFMPADTLWPLMLQFGACFIVSVALAALSRFTFEEWFLQMKAKPTREILGDLSANLRGLLGAIGYQGRTRTEAQTGS